MPTLKSDPPKAEEPEVTDPVEEQPASAGPTEDEVAALLARIAELEAAAKVTAPTAPSTSAPGAFPVGESWGVGAEFQFPADDRVYRHTEEGWVQVRTITKHKPAPAVG